MALLALKADFSAQRFVPAQRLFLYAAPRVCCQTPFVLGRKLPQNIVVRNALRPGGKGKRQFGYHDQPLVCFEAVFEGIRRVSVKKSGMNLRDLITPRFLNSLIASVRLSNDLTILRISDSL